MRLRHVVFILGGALASLLAGIAVWLAMVRWHAHDLLDPHILPFWLFSLISVVGGALNFIPLRGRRSNSDGLQIVRTLRGGPAVACALALSGLRGCVERRERPR
jgi:hypothetical protein